MNGSFLLDTNIVIALFAGDASVMANIAAAEEVFIPAAVIGELFYGARKSGRPAENAQRIEEFVADNVILSCDAETARLYGDVKSGLQRKGRPIPENDIWIAAVALQHNLILVSRDEHFEAIEWIRRATW
ncbi:MAG: tRNA(fMet)-specific endonuclease VapC [Candidatus Electronema aureum]|uniref:Ribonuclease VapC n=1 Tax=Candidatus Electronema aureum TaxID=2005002 RepID=A0A521G4D3_9BACT|nr:type II toxin-antitoxin system VapC family toxin [Desulfobulbus sp. F5]TAA75843.1 MAG: tRNA(fMet)-specific endonuclease VapC [Candidatus Electronema aureum]